MRTELIEAFNIWINVPPQELAIITKVVKMLHTASLLYVFFPRLLAYMEGRERERAGKRE